MTVAELRKLLDGVPDDLVVISNDIGGYPEETSEAQVMTAKEGFGDYLANRDPEKLWFFIY